VPPAFHIFSGEEYQLFRRMTGLDSQPKKGIALDDPDIYLGGFVEDGKARGGDGADAGNTSACKTCEHNFLRNLRYALSGKP
jgi:hypothetical protein